ncbi:MAG TPA: LptE family protein [Verrucomicrobiae bacterium]|nr:LptE family protein [Verrucomicrobiae bacterium]
MSKSIIVACVAAVAVGGCAYRLGSIAGEELRGVRTIYVPVVKNETYEPSISVMVTDAIIQNLHRDGTLRVVREPNADATLDVKLIEFERRPQRSSRRDTRQVAEYRVELKGEATLKKRGDAEAIFKGEEFTGETEFFIGQDLQEAERQAMGLLAEDLARKIVSKITEGW